MLKRIFVLAICVTMVQGVFAQKTSVFTEAELHYKRGLDFYEKGLFGQAQREFEAVLAENRLAHEPQYATILSDSELNRARCAVQMGAKDGEQLISDFIRKYSPDPVGAKAVIEMGNYYYNSKKYDEASRFYDMLSVADMSAQQRQEVKFKQGYAYFINKKFPQAKGAFKGIKDIDGQYYYPSNYYYAMTCFFDGSYDEAIKSFDKVSSFKKYKPLVPYYIAQIYFAQGKYDQLIAAVEPKLKDSETTNLRELNQLVGQAYFEKENYKKAQPLLEKYAEGTAQMREEEFYQLGFTQYKNEDYKKAIKNFQEISGLDSNIGQNASYYLADCFLKVNNKPSARLALANAAKLSFDKSMQEEANFNYGKLSYELKNDRDALTALQKVKPGSKYYSESQNILAQLFLNSRDYDKALSIISGIQDKSPQMIEAQQKVMYYRGVQYYNDGDMTNAKSMFNGALNVPADNRIKALSLYALADIGHQSKDYEGSIRYTSQFLTMAKSVSGLPDESSTYTANYMQGYNYLKQGKHSQALGFFQEAATSIKRDKSQLSNAFVEKQVLGDATLRAGDCYFKSNKYKEASRFYDEAIKNNYSGFVYAMYQKGIIDGLEGRLDDKIIALERLTRDYPNSEYADEALLQTALAYQDPSVNKLNKAIVPLKTLINDYKGKSNLIPDAYTQLGLIYYNQGNTDQAIKYYKDVFNNNPSKEKAEEALGALENIYVDLGKTDEFNTFKTSLGYKVNENDKDALAFKSAETKFENNEWEKAIPLYTSYLKSYGKSANALTAYFHRGESNAGLKKYAEAQADYEEVVNRGQSQYYSKAMDKAIRIATNLVKDDKKAYELYKTWEKTAANETDRFKAQLGALEYAYKFKDNKAVTDLAAKVIKNPAASKAQQASANYYLAKAAYENKDFESARIAFNQVIRLDKDSEEAAEARYNIAYIYYVQRDLEAAEQLCNAANKESSGHDFWIAKSVILLADIYTERGDNFNAKAMLEAVIENFTGDKVITAEAKEKLARLEGKTPTRLMSKDKENGQIEMQGEKN